MIDGNSVDFNFQLKGGEYISVYPVFETFDISALNHLNPKPLRKIKFICDVNLGKLALKLRLLGFDTIYRNDLEDHEIISLSLNEKSTILTRDIGLLKLPNVTHGYWICNEDPKNQIKEVVGRFQLEEKINPFTRCTQCNGSLKQAKKELIKDKMDINTYNRFDQFMECQSCGKIYWKGSYYDNISKWINELKVTSSSC